MNKTSLDISNIPRIPVKIEKNQSKIKSKKNKTEISGLSIDIWKVIFQFLEPIEKQKLKGVSRHISRLAVESIQVMGQEEELALTKKSIQNVIILRTYLNTFLKGTLSPKIWGELYLNKQGCIEGMRGADEHYLILDDQAQGKFKQIYDDEFKEAVQNTGLIKTNTLWLNCKWDLTTNNTPFTITISGDIKLSLVQDQVFTNTFDRLNAKAVEIWRKSNHPKPDDGHSDVFNYSHLKWLQNFQIKPSKKK